MKNPFRMIAPGMFALGAIFCLLGLMLLKEAIPTLFVLDRHVPLLNMIVGVVLFSSGIKNLFYAIKQAINLQDNKLDIRPIDYLYTKGDGGKEIPRSLMTSGVNPNEEMQPHLVKWLSRLFPKLEYLPYPYTALLHSMFVAFGLGFSGLVILLLLRMILTDDVQIALILDWYYWIYILIGVIFWIVVSRYGFVSVQRLQDNLLPAGIIFLFKASLFAAVVGAYLLAKSEIGLAEPPYLPDLTAIVWAGTITLIVAAFAMTVLRSMRAPIRYSVSQEEEHFKLRMHPTDVVTSIKACARYGRYFLLGSWKPHFFEHTAVEAGEFEANLNAEYNIHLKNPSHLNSVCIYGILTAWAGMILCTIAGFLLWNATRSSWGPWVEAVHSFSIPISLMVFGSLLYRIGTIPLAELKWDSILIYCYLEGSFQKQGNMTIVNAGDHHATGSVLTHTTCVVYCAFARSIGFFTPTTAKITVPRQIYNVEPAPQVAKELLMAIQKRAKLNDIGLGHFTARPALRNQ